MFDHSLQVFQLAFGGVLHLAHLARQLPDIYMVPTTFSFCVRFSYIRSVIYMLVSRRHHHHHYCINGIAPFSLQCYWYILIYITKWSFSLLLIIVSMGLLPFHRNATDTFRIKCSLLYLSIFSNICIGTIFCEFLKTWMSCILVYV